MRNLEIAVLDTPINRNLNCLNHEVSFPFEYSNLEGNIHGSTCLYILDYLLEEKRHVNISYIPILDDEGYGDGKSIVNAIEWCGANKISIINMSLGSVLLRDYSILQRAIIEYTRNGGVIIAAKNNYGKYSVPADIFPVIGVSVNVTLMGRWIGQLTYTQTELLSRLHIGSEDILIERCNSYATAAATAEIINKYYYYITDELFSVKDFINKIWEDNSLSQAKQPFLPDFFASSGKQKDARYLNDEDVNIIKNTNEAECIAEVINMRPSKYRGVILLCECRQIHRDIFRKNYGAFFWDVNDYNDILASFYKKKIVRDDFLQVKIIVKSWNIEKVEWFQQLLQQCNYNVKLAVPYADGILYQMFYVPKNYVSKNLCNLLSKLYNLDVFIFLDDEEDEYEYGMWDEVFVVNELNTFTAMQLVKKMERIFGTCENYGIFT